MPSRSVSSVGSAGTPCLTHQAEKLSDTTVSTRTVGASDSPSVGVISQAIVSPSAIRLRASASDFAPVVRSLDRLPKVFDEKREERLVRLFELADHEGSAVPDSFRMLKPARSRSSSWR